jgi:hypothetical protein
MHASYKQPRYSVLDAPFGIIAFALSGHGVSPSFMEEAAAYHFSQNNIMESHDRP